MYTLMFLGAFASSAIAQAVSYSNTTFTAPVKVGSVWPISFSAGNREPVAIAFGNSTYAFQIVDGLSAPGTYPWEVAVPVNVVNGTYQLALIQGDADPVFSPAFTLEIPPEEAEDTSDSPETTVAFPGPTVTATTTTTVTAIYLPYPSNMTMPTVTYIYWEESCGCHMTSSCAQSEVPTSLSTTTVTYLEAACGCTTIMEAPCAETEIPVTPAAATPAPATNTPVAPTVAPAAPAEPTTTQSALPTYTGAGLKLAGSSLSFLAVVVALVLA